MKVGSGGGSYSQPNTCVIKMTQFQLQPINPSNPPKCIHVLMGFHRTNQWEQRFIKVNSLFQYLFKCLPGFRIDYKKKNHRYERGKTALELYLIFSVTSVGKRDSSNTNSVPCTFAFAGHLARVSPHSGTQSIQFGAWI